MWPGYRRHDEAVQVVEHAASDQLAEGAGLSGIGASERSQVPFTVPLVDHHRWEAEPNEQEIHHQTPGATVAVEKGMDALELGVSDGERLDEGCFAQRGRQ